MGSHTVEKLLVTGIDGPVGGAVAGLAAERGISVVGYAPGDTHGREERDDRVVVRGPASSPTLMETLVEGVSHVAHTWVDARPHATYEDLKPINLTFSEHLFEAAHKAGARRVVYVSEARLYAPSQRYVGESGSVRPTEATGQCLYDAEILLRGLANRHPSGPALTVLRRAHLYGHPVPPPEAPWWALPGVLAQTFELVPGLSGGPRSQWLHLDDLARAILHTATLEAPENERAMTFNVADDAALTLGELFNGLIESCGYPLGVKVPVPGPGLLERLLTLLDGPRSRAALGALLRRAWRSANGPLSAVVEPRLEDAVLAGLAEERLIRSDRLKATGYRFAHPDPQVGLAEVMARYRREGWLPAAQPAGDEPEERAARALESSFAETMRGHFRRSPEGPSHPIEFHVRMTTPGLRLPIVEHTWKMDGRLTAESLASDAALRGTFRVGQSGSGDRQLVYEFGFTADDGRSYRFEGVKHPRWRSPTRSFTTMGIRIRDQQGACVGTGEMAFDLKGDLIPFLRSFRLGRGA